jgi:hypothetical protein
MATNEEPTIGGEDAGLARRRTGPHAPLPAAPPPPPQAATPDEDDPRSRAAARAAELREHRGSLDEGTDKFYIDRRIIPDGWSYEWKTLTVLNQPNPSYQVQLARAGWEPVPRYRHPEMMPDNYPGDTIERDGQILMERPKEITDEATSRDLRNARAQVRQKEAQLNGQPAGASSPFDPTNKGTPMVKIGKSYEPMPIPEK